MGYLNIIWQAFLSAIRWMCSRYVGVHETSDVPFMAKTLPRDETGSEWAVVTSHRPHRTSSFLNIHNRLYLALLDEKQSEAVARNVLQKCYLVVTLDMVNIRKLDEHDTPELETFDPQGLGDIFRFDEMANALARKDSKLKLVFQTGADQRVQRSLTFLLGCHMILSHGVGFEEAYLAFRQLHHLVEFDAENSVTIRSCWRAFCCAKVHGWVDFNPVLGPSPYDADCMHIEEYLHYARHVADSSIFGPSRK